MQSQIPSQAQIMNSELGVIWVLVTSGYPETAIFSEGRVDDLYSQSPIALLTARFPSTLPEATVCPAATILECSDGTSGLWSFDNSKAFPFSHSTLLESPVLAQYTWVSDKSKTFAVHPAVNAGSQSEESSSFWYFRISVFASFCSNILSILTNTLRSAAS